VEQFPKLEGRQMVMVLAPKRKGPAPKAKETKEVKEVKPAKPATPPKRQAA
jgi:hypothetical protein